MYLDCEIKIPVVPGRINQIKKGKTTYIRYVLKRTYHADKKYNVPEQKVIGKRSETSSELMIPNENFLKYFADVELPVMKKDRARSSCLRIGNYFVMRKIMEEYRLPQMLEKYLEKRDTGLFLDLVAYSISVKIMLRSIIRTMRITIRYLQKGCIYTVIQGSQISFPG